MTKIIFISAIPFFFLLIAIEYYWGKRNRKKLYDFADSITNLNIGIGNQAFSLFVKAIVLGVYVLIYEKIALFQIPPGILSFIACFVLYDFIFYWAHRWGHEINFFWGAHVVHHQSEEYNLSVALRQPWFHTLIAFVLFLPMPILGFDPGTFFVVAAINTLYQFWIHTKAIDKMWKPIEWIFNTPSHHRVHHGRNPKYIDKNHAGVFIIWDRMFHTFQKEEEEPIYGITTPLKSYNPIWANIHYYVEMLSLSKLIRRPFSFFNLMGKKPGWKPEELGGFTPPPPIENQDTSKYGFQLPAGLNRYVAIQFVGLTAGLMAFMYHFENLSAFYRWVFLGIILMTTLICGAILEKKSWVGIAERLRLALVALSFSSLYYYWFTDWFLFVLIVSAIGFVGFNLWFGLNWRKLRINGF